MSQSHSQFQRQPISSDYKVNWGNLDSLLQIDNELNTCFDTVITWRKIFFLVLRRKAGKSSIAEAARILNLYNYNTSRKLIALKALMVFLPMMLQKPIRTSKAKDHCNYLQKILKLWEEGKFNEILRECMEIQKRLQVDQQKSRFNLNKTFTRLMLSGNVSQAAKLINRRKGGVLKIDEEVKEQLIKKHPKASAAKRGTLLFGYEEKVEHVIFESIDADLVCKVVKTMKGSVGPTLI